MAMVPDVVVRVPSENCTVKSPAAPVKVSPLNVAIPRTIVAVAPVSVLSGPDAIVAVIVPLADVTTLPPTSRTVTMGCVPSGTPFVPEDATWVTCSAAAAPMASAM